ncbi:hypothetical protein FX983_06092 [Pseudomonas frederiksbergensis]|uniref:Uncharacterized protein n=1 Tax=Pseudomonas frederiksbergensis TaxID=104087 RepID=A0A6L5BW27_9PSED|nr:hypothetical protein FX983_06092 [Pseudomonas frederiksbergensis]
MLAKGPSHSTSLLAGRPLSRASPLPQGICVGYKFCERHPSNVGARLAREDGVSANINSADTPLSRASPLPQGICVGYKFCERHPSNVGARLAREDGVSVNIYATDTPLSRASPLPQGICVGYKFCERHPSNVGARLAREDGVSGMTPSRASFAPTRACGYPVRDWPLPLPSAASDATPAMYGVAGLLPARPDR